MKLGSLYVEITPLAEPITIEKFKEGGIHVVEKGFREKGEIAPMACLLSKNKDVVFYVLPNFADEDGKDTSMLQIRALAKMIECEAYTFMSESWLTMISAEDKEKMRFVKDLNYKASLLPDRKEVIILTFESRNPKVSEMIVWDISRNPNKLSEKQIIPGGENQGRMVNILDY